MDGWMEKEVRKRKIAGADIRSQRTISRSADNKGSVNTITLKGEKDSSMGTSTGFSTDKLDSRTENPGEVLGEGNQSPPQPPPPPPQPTFQHSAAIPLISENVRAVRIEKYAKLFKIDTKRLHRGSGAVDILIGIDHAPLHGGNTLVNGNFAVWQSPVGAVVSGAGPDGLCSVNRMHLVRLNDPVDLTSFWSTEQLGVEVNPCYTKRTPGGKLLSSIEKEARGEDYSRQ
ncbi:Hypothetical predicted protein [Paramuricea clavata]|uniref:Uncharacterized protein n=1 Tax=Paramuricea clavata TaxID=317549 RepID=A0A6S7HDW5_PARCT|nr:Hypothetical predicted protein [Paramuricea clavata]